MRRRAGCLLLLLLLCALGAPGACGPGHREPDEAPAGSARPRPPDPEAHDPDVRLRVALASDRGERCLFVGIEGSAFVARWGCDAPTSRRLPGWGPEAQRALARVVDQVLGAVGGESGRLEARVAVNTSAAAHAGREDVAAVADALRRAGVTSVETGSERGGARREPSEAELVWLAAHQEADGRWSPATSGDACDGFAMREPADDGAGDGAYDVATTGLVLCAFLGAGYTHRGRHPFAKAVLRGLCHLKGVQGTDGAFGDPRAPYTAESHALATLALVQAYGTTGSPIFRDAAQQALRHLPRAWASGAVDDLATPWTIAAVNAARRFDADRERRGKEGLFTIDERFVLDLEGDLLRLERTGTPRSAAVALFGRVLLGEDPHGPRVADLADLAGREPPAYDADRPADVERWLFASLGLFEVGGAPWKTWSRHLKDTLVSSQRRDGAVCCHRGSWDPRGRRREVLGRPGTTALLALCLQVYYRYRHVCVLPR